MYRSLFIRVIQLHGFVKKSTSKKLILFSFILLNFNAIAQKSKPLVEGKVLLKDSVLHDLDLLEKALTEIHPGIYRYNTEEGIKTEFDVLRSRISNSISEAELMKRLAQTITKIRCGHTYLNPWNMDNELRTRLFGGQIYFPLGFKIIVGRFYVTHNASENEEIKKGAEILSINGVAIQTIYDSLKTIARSDGHNYAPFEPYLSVQNYTSYNWNAFDLYFPLFFPFAKPEFSITYQNFEETVSKRATLKALDKGARKAKMLERYGKEVLNNTDWTFDLSDPQVAIMRLGTFATWNFKDFNSKKWFKEAFQQIDELAIPNLIVDIRGNGGGLGEHANELMEYLVKEEIKCRETGKVLIRTTKVDEALLPYCETYYKNLLKGLPTFMYTDYNEQWYELKEKGDCVDINPTKKRFKGKVFLLGGPSNVSATYTLLKRANEYGFAATVGGVSGGNQQGINGGAYIFFRMPYSKMKVDIPLKFFAPAVQSPDAGIEPNVKIQYSQKDIAIGTDPHVEYVKSIIE